MYAQVEKVKVWQLLIQLLRRKIMESKVLGL